MKQPSVRVVGALLAGLSALCGSSKAESFRNDTPIIINDATIFGPSAATPYPSSINVSGLRGTITGVTVSLSDLTHTFPFDISAQVQSARGTSLLILNERGGGFPGVTGIDVTFDDNASSEVPVGSFPSGTYRVSADLSPGPLPFPAPADDFPHQGNLSIFNGENPNGTWNLFVIDRQIGDTGIIAGGWALTITVADLDAIFSAINTGLPMALSQREAVFDAVAATTRDVNGRLFRLRSRANGDTTMAVSASTSMDGKGVTPRDYKGDYKDKQPIEPERKRFELFASGDFGFTDRESIGETFEFVSDTQAATVGAEFHATENLTFGLGLSYINTSTYLGNHVGRNELDGFAVSPYISFFSNGFYIDGLYSFSIFDHEISRNTGLGDTARATPDSRNHTIQVNTGYNFQAGGLVTGPLASLDYTRGDLDGYEEEGGGFANVKVRGQNYDSLISKIGWQISYPVRTGFGAITPQVRAAWGHQYRNDDEPVTATLSESPFFTVGPGGVAQGGRFSATANTRAPGEDWLILGAGLSTEFGDCFTLLLDYEAYVAQDDNEQHFASIRASVKF